MRTQQRPRGWLSDLLRAAEAAGAPLDPVSSTYDREATAPAEFAVNMEQLEAELSEPPPPPAPRGVGGTSVWVGVRPPSEADQYLSDLRDAHHLNTLWTAMQHGGVDAWTPELVARWRRMRAETEDVAAGRADSAAVPRGHGPVVRTAVAARLEELAVRAAALRSPSAAPPPTAASAPSAGATPADPSPAPDAAADPASPAPDVAAPPAPGEPDHVLAGAPPSGWSPRRHLEPAPHRVDDADEGGHR